MFLLKQGLLALNFTEAIFKSCFALEIANEITCESGVDSLQQLYNYVHFKRLENENEKYNIMSMIVFVTSREKLKVTISVTSLASHSVPGCGDMDCTSVLVPSKIPLSV